MDDLLQKWKAWLDQVFEQQLMDLLINQHIFKQLVECIEPHVGTRTGAHLAEWMAQGYAAFAATAIRRMVERPRSSKPKTCPHCGKTVVPLKPEESLSLVILLDDIKEAIKRDTTILSRSWFRKRHSASGVPERCADRDFASITRDDTAETLMKDRVREDIDTLERDAKPVRQLVNKTIAHTNRDRSKVQRHTYGELNDAIVALKDVYGRYHLLITGKQCSFVPLDDFDVQADLERIWPNPARR